MFFVLSKIFWMLAAPSHWLDFLVLAAMVCVVLRRIGAARIFALAALLLFVVLGFATAPLMRALEDHYPRGPWPAHVDGVLVLGSGYDTALLRARGAPQLNGGAYRLVEGFAAARRYPGARLMFTGGSGALGGALYAEAGTARYVFTELGQDPARMVLEARSRNTYENILFSKDMVKPKPGEVWLLVTSAFHMPRAMAIARKLDWPMLPWPSDYMTTPGKTFAFNDDMGMADLAVHEWVGLLAYRLTGKAS